MIEEKVGYKKPPKETQFKPGVSGNPSGRKKRSMTLFELVDKECNAKIVVSENGNQVKITKKAAVAKQIVNKAVKADEIKSLRLSLEIIQAAEKRVYDACVGKNAGTVDKKYTVEEAARAYKEAIKKR